MPRKQRKTQYQFGSAAGAQEIAQYGSFAAGAPLYTTDPADIQDLVQYEQGWQGASVSLNPAIEDRNALDYLFAYQLQYLLQAGIPEWDAETTYFTGQVVSVGNQYGFQYVSLADDNLNHAVTDPLYWRKIDGQVTTPKTSGFTLTAADNGCIIPCNTSGGAFNITLPTGGAAKNFSFTVKDVAGTFDTNPLGIVRIGSEKIENVAASYSCNIEYGSYTFYTDGTDWFLKTGGQQKIALPFQAGDTTYIKASLVSSNLVFDIRANSNVYTILQFGANAADRAGFRTSSGGELEVYTGTVGSGTKQASFLANGVFETRAGIKFPSTQVSSSDANTLDDYEEGSFTPGLQYQTPGSSSIGYSSRAATYTKIGRQVHASGYVVMNSFSKGTAAGNLRITGLPFACKNAVENIVYTPVFVINWTFDSAIPMAGTGPGATTLDLVRQVSGGAATNLNDPSATSTVYFQVSYMTD